MKNFQKTETKNNKERKNSSRESKSVRALLRSLKYGKGVTLILFIFLMSSVSTSVTKAQSMCPSFCVNYGIFENSGDFENFADFFNSRDFVNKDTIKNLGSFAGNGTFTNTSVISPGNSPGTLNIGGNALIFDGSAAKYLAELSTSSNDEIITTGAATLAGELEVLLIDGKIPSMGESFDLMTYGSVSGTFGNVILPSGYNWSLDYGATALTLTMNSILPVELVHFQGMSEANSVELGWSTSTEIDNDYFDVERSSDGSSFEVIGRINGNGTTNEEQHYSFIDRSPLSGKNYYRLRQVDYDGSTDYSKIILVERKASSLDYKILTNPIENKVLNLRIDGLKGDPIMMSMRDMRGAEILNQELERGENAISMAGYGSGIYVIILTYKKERYVDKVVVIN